MSKNPKKENLSNVKNFFSQSSDFCGQIIRFSFLRLQLTVHDHLLRLGSFLHFTTFVFQSVVISTQRVTQRVRRRLTCAKKLSDRWCGELRLTDTYTRK